ncbi:MAG: hypothetical protein PHD04_04980 [Candidatus Pacebacteria bacterium]|nr:hypothetical protein [Candidatus Paceibacterota bacterium]
MRDLQLGCCGSWALACSAFLMSNGSRPIFTSASTHERPKDSAMPFVIHPFDTPAATPNWHRIIGEVMGGVSVSPMRLSHV